jgi:hypothetical protein
MEIKQRRPWIEQMPAGPIHAARGETLQPGLYFPIASRRLQ